MIMKNRNKRRLKKLNCYQKFSKKIENFFRNQINLTDYIFSYKLYI